MNIVDKIKKLLSVAAGEANEKESALALKMATRLMAKYAIDEAVLTSLSESGQECETPGHVMLYASKRPPQWAISLALGLCEANGCRVSRVQGYGLRMYGFECDRARVRVLWDIIEPQIHRWVKYRGLSRVQASSYRHGMAYTIGQLLEKATDERVETLALVPVSRARDEAVDAFYRENVGRLFKSRAKTDRSAFEKGAQDARRVQMSEEKRALL